jgi:phage terminase small subunit
LPMTAKQERFVAEYLIDLNATRAYQSVYKCSEKVAAANGSRLLTNAEIKASVAKVQSKVVAKLEFSVEQHMDRLRALSIAAEASNQYSAAVKAEELRGKVSGFYVEQVEHSGAIDLSAQEREQAVLGFLTVARKRQKELLS